MCVQRDRKWLTNRQKSMILRYFTLITLLSPYLHISAIPVTLTTSNNQTVQNYGDDIHLKCTWDLSHHSLSNLNISENEIIKVRWVINDDAKFEIRYNEKTGKYHTVKRRLPRNKMEKKLKKLTSTSNRWLTDSVKFDMEAQTSSLQLNNLQIQDQGKYNCEVELRDLITSSDQPIGSKPKYEIFYNEHELDLQIISKPSILVEANTDSLDIRNFELALIENEENQDIVIHKEELIGVCRVKDAYPKPETIFLYVGGTEGLVFRDLVGGFMRKSFLLLLHIFVLKEMFFIVIKNPLCYLSNLRVSTSKIRRSVPI